MSGAFWLDWPVLAVSLFNTMLLLWLGLTVLLNAERRTAGIWLGSSGLFAGGLFFLSHTILASVGLALPERDAEFWWRLGWLPVTLAPFAWYLACLWYAGYWQNQSQVRHHRIPLYVLSLGGTLLAGLLLFANPLPSFSSTVRLESAPAGIPPNVPMLSGGAILLLACFPVFILACTGLALNALLRPGRPRRLMGDLARRRARPWLVAATLLLLLVSLLVAGLIIWALAEEYQGRLDYSANLVSFVTWADLVIAGLIALVVLFIGQAIASYEVFTGKALPSQGLLRTWRRAVVLAAGYGGLAALGLALPLPPIYIVLLGALLIVAFFALLAWRSYAERQRQIAQLRPFVASQGLYGSLLSPAPTTTDLQAPFCALTESVLGSRQAYLLPQGPLAALFGPALTCPPGLAAPNLTPLLPQILATARPETLFLALPDHSNLAFDWVVPLWNERGLVGLLLLDEKRDGSPYTQEEIEIARATGERLMDLGASAELAQRLVTIQRQRLEETQVLDRRARRVLHDDLLPRLHEAMLSLSSEAPQAAGVLAQLAEVHHGITDLLREMPARPAPELARSGLVTALKDVLDGELMGAFERATWQVQSEAEAAMLRLPEFKAGVLFYAAREGLRNAARYGRGGDPDRPIHLTVRVEWLPGLQISILDDGAGSSAAPNDRGGSRQGLALHSTLLAVIGGSLLFESQPGSTTLTLRLPAEACG